MPPDRSPAKEGVINTSNRWSVPHRRPQRSSLFGFGLVLGFWILGTCDAGQPEVFRKAVLEDAAGASSNPEEVRMFMTVGERRFAITLADTDAARAFVAQLPLTLDMAELNGNEKHADLALPLPTEPVRPVTIHEGGLMLYGSNTVVVFYETFRSSYSYTRLGRVDDPSDLSQVLGRRSVRVVFTKQ